MYFAAAIAALALHVFFSYWIGRLFKIKNFNLNLRQLSLKDRLIRSAWSFLMTLVVVQIIVAFNYAKDIPINWINVALTFTLITALIVALQTAAIEIYLRLRS